MISNTQRLVEINFIRYSLCSFLWAHFHLKRSNFGDFDQQLVKLQVYLVCEGYTDRFVLNVFSHNIGFITIRNIFYE